MAARFWVGGSGTWNNSSTTNWSATSGGASGASAPTTADTVTFDANSGTAATVTVAATAATSTCTVNKSDITLSLSGSPTFTGLFTLTTGTLSLGSNTLTCLSFSSSNSNARTLAFGAGNITLTGSGATIWNTDVSTNLTVTGTPIVNSTYSGSTGTRLLDFGNATTGSEANAISINITAGTDSVSLYGNWIKDINFTGFSGTLTNVGNRTFYGNLTLSSGMNMTAGVGQFNFAATSGTKTITSNGNTIEGTVTFNGIGGTFQLQDNLTLGITRGASLTNGTLDLNGKVLTCGLFASNNSNSRTLAFGSGSITVNGSGTIWNTATVTNMAVTGSKTVNVSNNSANAATVNAGSLAEANALNFNFTIGSYALTFASTAENVDFTGFAGTLGAISNVTVYGNLTIASGMTLSSSASALTFGATSGTKTITTNGKTLDFPLTFNGVGGTFAFSDALTQGSTRAFTITNGTVQLKAATTSTIGSFTAGAGTTQRFLQSTLTGTQATLSGATGTNAATYLTIQDIAAVGGATWNAYADNGNVDAGNNSGWNFGLTPQLAYEFPTQLRSITERRHF